MNINMKTIAPTKPMAIRNQRSPVVYDMQRSHPCQQAVINPVLTRHHMPAREQIRYPILFALGLTALAMWFLNFAMTV